MTIYPNTNDYRPVQQSLQTPTSRDNNYTGTSRHLGSISGDALIPRGFPTLEQRELFPDFCPGVSGECPRGAIDARTNQVETAQERQFTLKYRTKSGIRVRSKIEKIIADFLFDEKIRFIYEPQVRLDGFDIAPDFYLPDYSVFYEHFGLDTPAYRQSAKLKIGRYQRAGVPFMYTTFQDEPEIEDAIVVKLAKATSNS